MVRKIVFVVLGLTFSMSQVALAESTVTFKLGAGRYVVYALEIGDNSIAWDQESQTAFFI